MALERERVDQLLEAKKQQLVAGAGDDAEAQLQQAFHQVVSCESSPWKRLSFSDPADVVPPPVASVEAPPSLLPQKRYCDITGLEVSLPPSSRRVSLLPR
jgi:hypothetical protein